MKKHFLSLAALLVMIVFAFGSKDGGNSSSPRSYSGGSSYSAPSPTAKEAAFESDIVPMPTPFGAIDKSSVKENSDGKITYKTSDGKSWVVEVTRDEDGRFHYSEPEEE